MEARSSARFGDPSLLYADQKQTICPFGPPASCQMIDGNPRIS
jgi:hypothetical protein